MRPQPSFLTFHDRPCRENCNPQLVAKNKRVFLTRPANASKSGSPTRNTMCTVYRLRRWASNQIRGKPFAIAFHFVCAPLFFGGQTSHFFNGETWSKTRLSFRCLFLEQKRMPDLTVFFHSNLKILNRKILEGEKQATGWNLTVKSTVSPDRFAFFCYWRRKFAEANWRRNVN